MPNSRLLVFLSSPLVAPIVASMLMIGCFSGGDALPSADSEATGGATTAGGGALAAGGGASSGGSAETGCPAEAPFFTVGECLAEDGPSECVTSFSKAGAFAEGNWMEGWTNWSTDSTPEDDGSIDDLEIIESDITTDTTWRADTVYQLGTQVHVVDGATLTIQPGTLIKSFAAGALIVSRGSKLIAQGTASAPIVFTSGAENGEKKRGNWGGLTISGKARFWGGEDLSEGLPDDDINKYGGGDDKDDSGVLEYVRIEFSGAEFGAIEPAGLTLAAVGSGTTVSHIQVNTTQDDGVEWLGGKVDADHLVVNNVGGDLFDADAGLSGTLSHLFGRHITPLSGDPNGLELDGDNEGEKEVPVNTLVHTEHVTLCGTGEPGFNPSFGAVLRENLEGSHSSMVSVGFDAAFDLRDQVNVTIEDSWVWGQPLSPENEEDDGETVDEADWFTSGHGNTYIE